MRLAPFAAGLVLVRFGPPITFLQKTAMALSLLVSGTDPYTGAHCPAVEQVWLKAPNIRTYDGLSKPEEGCPWKG
jgi:hypothetical protein